MERSVAERLQEMDDFLLSARVHDEVQVYGRSRHSVPAKSDTADHGMANLPLFEERKEVVQHRYEVHRVALEETTTRSTSGYELHGS